MKTHFCGFKNEIPMKFPWKSHEIPMKFPWNPLVSTIETGGKRKSPWHPPIETSPAGSYGAADLPEALPGSCGFLRLLIGIIIRICIYIYMNNIYLYHSIYIYSSIYINHLYTISICIYHHSLKLSIVYHLVVIFSYHSLKG